jgi:hypothetical protein
MTPLRLLLRSLARFLYQTFSLVLCSAMIAQFLAKNVFGMKEFLYLDDPSATSIIEVQSSGALFENSKTNRIVEFYSPYCVRVDVFIV